ncbi:hypothetical protein D9M73_221060 [compost metagenome]
MVIARCCKSISSRNASRASACQLFSTGRLLISCRYQVRSSALPTAKNALATCAGSWPVTSAASMIGSRVYRWLVPATIRASNSGTPASTKPW